MTETSRAKADRRARSLGSKMSTASFLILLFCAALIWEFYALFFGRVRTITAVVRGLPMRFKLLLVLAIGALLGHFFWYW